jgi:hypothetical protein
MQMQSIQKIHTQRMNVKNGSGPPNVEHSLMSALHGMQPPPNLLTQAHLMTHPDDGLDSYNSPQMSVEVGVTSIEAYGCGYVAIDVVSLLDDEDAQRLPAIIRCSGNS